MKSQALIGKIFLRAILLQSKKAPASQVGAFFYVWLAHLLLHHVQRPIHGTPTHLAALGRSERCLVRPVEVV